MEESARVALESPKLTQMHDDGGRSESFSRANSNLWPTELIGREIVPRLPRRFVLRFEARASLSSSMPETGVVNLASAVLKANTNHSLTRATERRTVFV
ncbi:hypothetical protein EVAR_100322_1 [Eumeta japonica]|uniref:Uncharacterized protein n=1 Tax=Eumeta variegata TaxID=151549 RepID=A0A4C1ZP31_EUMVA|nr:hypothetical protein EVAR_100322_1 [Eumeta japonica]